MKETYLHTDCLPDFHSTFIHIYGKILTVLLRWSLNGWQGWLCWKFLCAQCTGMFTQTLGSAKYSKWNLIYVLWTCIAVAAIWYDLGFVCIGLPYGMKLSNKVLHTKPLDEWVPMRIAAMQHVHFLLTNFRHKEQWMEHFLSRSIAMDLVMTAVLISKPGKPVVDTFFHSI